MPIVPPRLDEDSQGWSNRLNGFLGPLRSSDKLGQFFNEPWSSDWVPVIDAGTMTYTSEVYLARYFHRGKVCMFTLGVTGTTGGVATASFAVSLPVRARQHTLASVTHTFSTVLVDGGVRGGVAYMNSNFAQLIVQRYDAANFGLGTGRAFIVTGLYETE